MLNVKMKTQFLFFHRMENDLLAAFSMHPTTSTTRTCRGGGSKRGGGEGRGWRVEGGGERREGVGR